MLVFVSLTAVLIAAPIASACTAGPYTECVPSVNSGGGGSGGSGSAGGGSGGVSAANASSTPPASTIPTTGTATTAASSTNSSHSAGAAAKPKQAKPHRRLAAHGRSKPHVSTTPAHLSSSSSGGGGVPTIAWILAALAVVCLGAGSAQVLRSRRGSPATPRRT